MTENNDKIVWHGKKTPHNWIKGIDPFKTNELKAKRATLFISVNLSHESQLDDSDLTKVIEYRYNTRKDFEDERFYDVILNAESKRLKYSDLTKKS